MPKRTDLKTILIIGSGPIVIGQACEFDYSGTQACKALKEEGYKVVLVNSNPATIMTDPESADVTYIEPLTPEVLEKIIARERPDALLPTLGGQTGLNLSLKLSKLGILKKYGVELIGAKEEAIEKGEDREKFREAMLKIGLDIPQSVVVHDIKEAIDWIEKWGKFPVIIRPSYTLGGTGGGIAYNREEYENMISFGLNASPVTEVLVEECLLGWKEFEMEVMRDHKDQCVVICSIENFDPMGVHTGDSITIAPALTLTDKEYQLMRDASFAVIREVGVETGGSNIQFAVDPKTGRMIVIEMNPRVSRSSALASKATGFPIAKIAAKLAVGYSLDELRNDITRETPASFEPTIDYIVTKVPRFTFEKFAGSDNILTSSMKSVGEAMAIGRTFKESFQKALRSLEIGCRGFGGGGKFGGRECPSIEKIRKGLIRPTAERVFYIRYAILAGMSDDEIHEATSIDIWFLRQLRGIIEIETELSHKGLLNLDEDLLRRAKEAGMGYIVFTTKHHDGFAMYHSEVDHFNIVEATPFKRDILRELADACQRHGVALGIYYSHCIDWRDPNGADPGPNYSKNFGMSWGNDWDYPDYATKNFKRYFEQKALPQIRELLTNYGPIFSLWLDCPMVLTRQETEELYRTIKAIQPECCVSSRIGYGLGDYACLGDNQSPAGKNDFPLESARTLNHTWGYKEDDHNWQTSAAYWISGEEACSLTDESILLMGNSNEVGTGGNHPIGKTCYAGLSIRCIQQ